MRYTSQHVGPPCWPVTGRRDGSRWPEWLAVWRSGNVVLRINISYSTTSPVSTEMGDRLLTGIQPRYVTS